MGWYVVFCRELVLMRKKMGKLGYVFSSVMFPVIYLFAFSWGLGSRLEISGGYIPFLAKRILGVTVMLNSFQQTSLSTSVGRIYFKTLQTLILSPIPLLQVASGLTLAGATRGLVMGALVYGVAWLFFSVPLLSAAAVLAMVLAAFFFAALGLVVGLWVNDPDELSLVNNFIMTPMIFFGGSFFPVEHLPALVRDVVTVLPLSLVNSLLRVTVWNEAPILKMLLLSGFACLILLLATRRLSAYNE
ncbi:ABC-2 family transporter [Anaerospora hongkongensis]|uniref:Transport permease protein n=1 Tax=Anaerospora hongkongensis TaxID=244830 RepID=A0A4R1PZ76_9FIRM|nr:ABC transporter permease [Anaerospora hongkongensis]TCL36839.1 ABC-2 family transporter [Anaerospora hongkongensis]